ncbi:hypothetical protein U1Q18_033944 [Sarracenia purpurea var. burkii]
MMLRSSSTPVLGSLLCPVSESPSNHHYSEPYAAVKHPSATAIRHKHHNKFSFPPPASTNLTTFSCHSSPICTSAADHSSGSVHPDNGFFRRAQSLGNLEGLADDEFSISNPINNFSRKPNSPILETISSFSSYRSRNRCAEEEVEEELEGNDYENSLRGEENAMDVRSGEGNWDNQTVDSNDQMSYLTVPRSIGLEEMYLARGLGVDGINIGFGGGGGRGDGGDDFTPVAFGREGDGNGARAEEHYQKLLHENPGNSLFLRNYAQFLYEKRDLARAEEYYSRAILADPKDGEVLSRYARLVWELHRDIDRASSYFERAAQASPHDSHVQAAHANFLWEIGEEDDDKGNGMCVLPQCFEDASMASANAWRPRALF